MSSPNQSEAPSTGCDLHWEWGFPQVMAMGSAQKDGLSWMLSFSVKSSENLFACPALHYSSLKTVTHTHRKIWAERSSEVIWLISTKNTVRSSVSWLLHEHGGGRGFSRGQSRRKCSESEKPLSSFFQPRLL